MPKVDYIIVGHGLAGSVLALSLVKNNHTVLIIDQPKLSSSSKVAAGLFQPMTFKRTVETWKGLESISFASEFYKWAESLLDERFFHPLPMYRIFSSFEEQNNWALKCEDTYFSNLIGESKNTEVESCNVPYGYGQVHHAGYVDISKLLEASENYFRQKNWIINENFDYDKIEILNDEIRYNEFSAKSILFCEGWLIKNNPWFSYIPMKPVKGEVLTVKWESKKFNSIVSGGLFSVPRINGDFKVGSNYNWNSLDEIPTEKVKEDFLSEISEMVKDKVQILDHKAGVRPASHDRRPIIGSHPQFSNLIVFNGLGARGVALAPFIADKLVLFLNKSYVIPDDISVKRFGKYYRSI